MPASHNASLLLVLEMLRSAGYNLHLTFFTSRPDNFENFSRNLNLSLIFSNFRLTTSHAFVPIIFINNLLYDCTVGLDREIA